MRSHLEYRTFFIMCAERPGRRFYSRGFNQSWTRTTRKTAGCDVTLFFLLLSKRIFIGTDKTLSATLHYHLYNSTKARTLQDRHPTEQTRPQLGNIQPVTNGPASHPCKQINGIELNELKSAQQEAILSGSGPTTHCSVSSENEPLGSRSTPPS